MLITDLLTDPPTEAGVTELLRDVIDPELGRAVVWSPAWNPDRDMTDRAKELLGWRG